MHAPAPSQPASLRAAIPACRPLKPHPVPTPPAGTCTCGSPFSAQVKSEDGQQTFILKLQYDNSLGQLRACIDKHRAKLKPPPPPTAVYEIRSAFPSRAYINPAETLRTAGLIPNATLFLRAV